MSTNRVCIGAVVGVHGVRGAIRIKSFTADPLDVASYGPVQDEAGSRTFKLKVKGEVKGLVVAELDGIKDRDAAEALRGTALYVARDRMPDTDEDEFLYSDLVGLKAVGLDGQVIGTVKGVADFGAGELLDVIRPGQAGMFVPFTLTAVPKVDLANGLVVIVPPVFADEKDGASDAGDWAVEAPRSDPSESEG